MTVLETVRLPDYSNLSVEENIEKARTEIDTLTLAEKMTSERTWEIAALASAATKATAGNPNFAESAELSAADYDTKIGWTESGRNLGTLQKMIATYRGWASIGRVEGCGFWTHYEFRNKSEELLPNTSYNEAKASRSPEAAQSLIQGALAVVPPAAGVHVAAEYLDTKEAVEALAVDQEASDHVYSVATQIIERGESVDVDGDPLREQSVVLELLVVLGKLRELASEDPQNPLLIEAKNLLRETLRILNDIAEASPEAVVEMISEWEDFLSSH